jgi:hypothetical protein
MEAMRIKQVSECTAFKRYFSIAIVVVVYFVMTVSLRDSSWHVKSKARTRKYWVRQEASRSMTSCGESVHFVQRNTHVSTASAFSNSGAS